MTQYELIEPDKVKEIFARSFAINKNTLEINTCFNTDCVDCFFYNESCNEGCKNKRKRWLDQPLFDWDKDIDWEKVPVDTPVIVKDSYHPTWHRRYFKEKDKSIYLTFDEGTTSWSAHSEEVKEEDKHEWENWYVCRLARPEDVEKYRKKDTENG